MTQDEQKICLVTGANSGIGKEIAIELAVAGARVVMVCRNVERGQAALAEVKARSGSQQVDLLIADLSSQTAIHALAKTIHERYDALHVLINNAGLVLTKKALSSDGIEMTLATNHLGPFLLTHLLIDLLQQSAPARIINISSAIHKWGRVDLDDLQYVRRKYHFMKAYAQSKLLLNMVSFELARRLAGSGVTVNCVHPGAVKTNLGSESAQSIWLKLLDKAIKFFFISPVNAAKPIIALALSAEFTDQTGQYFSKNQLAKASRASHDAELTKNVSQRTRELVELCDSDN